MEHYGGTVDVSSKDVVFRRAVACSVLEAEPGVIRRLRNDDLPKQGALQTARAAALLAAKHTAQTIPHCHPIRLTSVEVEFAFEESSVTVRCAVSAQDRTGPEMEALYAAAVAALTLYDMVKGVCTGAAVNKTQLLEKEGGKSGHWIRPRQDGEDR